MTRLPSIAAPARAALALATLALFSLGCAPNGGASTQGRAARPAPVSTQGSTSALRAGTPFAQVSAEARQSGRPILMYFWTSW